MMKYAIALILTVLFSVGSLQAQRDDFVTAVYVSDGETRAMLVGALVTAASGRDTVRGVAAKFDTGYTMVARFRCDRIFRDSVDLTVTCLGYKPFHKRYSARGFEGRIYVQLEPDEYLMSRIVVTGDRIAMIVKGDTTIYDAAAFKTMEGDRFSELIRQLPGIEIKNDRIYAYGEEVKRVYVDGRNLFGAHTSYSLSDLEADDVRKVRVYEEENPEARRMGDNTARKDKVMDVETYSKPNVVQGGAVELAGGASLERDYSGKHEVRHSEALRYYRNAESGNFRAEASHSENDGPKESASFGSRLTPSKQMNAYLNYEYRRGDSTAVTTYASLSKNENHKIETVLTDYFPTAEYDCRTVRSVSDALSRSLDVGVGNTTTLMRGKNSLAALVNFTFNQDKDRNDRATVQNLDDEETRTDVHSRSRTRRTELDVILSYRRKISEKSTFSLQASGTYSRQSGDGWNVDTLASVPGLRLLLNSDSRGKQSSARVSGEFRRQMGEHAAFAVSYAFFRRSDKSRQMAVDYLTEPQGLLDTANSYDYTVDSRRNMLSGEWSYNKDKFNCMILLHGSLYEVGQDERLPETDDVSRHFFLFDPVVNLTFGTPQRRLTFGFRSLTQELSVEMLRNSLDASNPLFIRAGNPDLRPATDASFDLRYTAVKADKSRTWTLGLSGGYVFNYIAVRQKLFMEDTYLPEYGYTAQKGAQLTTQTNVGGNYSLGASADYSQRVSFLKSTLRASVNYNYGERPYFSGETRYEARDHALKATLGLNTGFSAKLRFTLSSATDLGYYTTQGESNRYLRETLNGRADLQLGAKYFVFVGAAYELYRSSQSSLDRNNVIANAAFRRKFGKENKAALSVGVVDIFNRTNYMSTTLSADYLRTTTTSYLGRYGYAAFSCQF